ncbi:MAG TPA: dihydrolipoamide acetyltransferase family protein [Thermodesulfobacteriota bacterium]|nr:dihydrolipoamide acetyltransferase family protein [Thermodesulfobacteriota bacterium]
MAFEFKMPDLGEGLTEGEIVKWLVKAGDPVEEGQIFVQVETDKAVVDIPSPKKGVVLKLGAAEGETVQVGKVIIVIGEPGEKPEAEVKKKGEPQVRPSVGVVGELEEAPEEEEAPLEAERRVKPSPPKPIAVPLPKGPQILAVPMVRKLAGDLKVDLGTIKGTGPQGRITKEDVVKAAKERKPSTKEIPEKAAIEQPTADAYGVVERLPLRGMRRTIAQAMMKSKSTIPHTVNIDEADITQLLSLKAKARERAAQKNIHLTILPFVIKVVISALQEHPYLNASLDDERGEIILKKYYNIGLAVDTKDGLMVPVVKNVRGKNLFQLASDLAALSDKARNRTIELADLKGGTFTITNYGAMGGIYGFPIIHHPEVAILGMGKIQDKPVVVDGKIEIRKVLPLSLSFDHRVVDGAEAVRFMNTVIELLEDPGLILMEE